MATDASLLVEDDVTLLDQPFTQPQSGPAQPHLGGRQAQVVTCRVVSLSHPLQVALLDDVGIFR